MMRYLLKLTTLSVLVVGTQFSIANIAEAKNPLTNEETLTGCLNPFSASACQAKDPPVDDAPNSGGGGGAY